MRVWRASDGLAEESHSTSEGGEGHALAQIAGVKLVSTSSARLLEPEPVSTPERRSFLRVALAAAGGLVSAALAIPVVRFATFTLRDTAEDASWSDVGKFDEFRSLKEPVAQVIDVTRAALPCGSCLGDRGEGTDIAPKLVGVGQKYPPDRLAYLLHHRTAKMIEGGMPPVDLNPADTAALVAYLDSLRQLDGRSGGPR